MRTQPGQLSVSKLLRERNLLKLDPEYQREGGVWSLSKKRLFIDSLLNGFDIPKIYLHRLSRDKTSFDFAVVDGKQRIGTIFEFVEGGFGLDDDFRYSGSQVQQPPLRSQTYADFSKDARELFGEVTLDVVIIETPDLDDIEELFSRLNNGEKLNAAESRNALGGKMADLVRRAAKIDFFTQKLSFSNARYAHYEVACKLLYLEKEASKAPRLLKVVDLKKKYLDEFVRQYAAISDKDAQKLLDQLEANLKAISPIFENGDIELSKQSYPQLMYVFTTWILRQYGANEIKVAVKDFLRDFRLERNKNLEKDEDHRDAELSEYGRLMQQGTNDASSMEQRIQILTKRFLRENQQVELKDPKRAFTMEERWALWQRSGKKCENCQGDLPTLEDLDGDHIVLHMAGGPTTLENARALCIPCNRGAGNALHD